VARLESWKAIAAYLGRDVSTVQRWEKREGMPVHRHVHDKIGSVYAFPAELDAWWQGRRQGLEQEEQAPPRESEAGAAPAPVRRPFRPWAAAALAAAGAGVFGYWLGTRHSPPFGAQPFSGFRRLTDMAGLEESPALSPDGKTVAFTAGVGQQRQVFVRLVAGGPPLRITGDASDHQEPRWLPDGSGLVYFSPAAPGQEQGDVWEVPALGGTPRRLLSSSSEADVAADGRLACFRIAGGQVQLVSTSRDGAVLKVVRQFPGGQYYRTPRWSPDAGTIAYEQGDGVRFDVFATPSDGEGEPVRLTNDASLLAGLAWTPDGKAVIYSSSRASTLPYLPRFTLWRTLLAGTTAEPLTPDEASYTHPGMDRLGRLAASRLLMQSDLWAFPLDGAPADNARRAQRLTRQTAQLRTPTVSPDGREIAFLSDSGGHANLWVMPAGGGDPRQITHEHDDAGAVGVPIWSPDGRSIAFVSSRGHVGFVFGVWLVNPDGSGLRKLVPRGWGAAWSADGLWLYYVDGAVLKKVPAGGGPPVTVRNEPVRNVIGERAGALYYVVERPLVDGRPEIDVRVASPEDGPSRVVAHVPAARVPEWQIVNPSLSPDGAWVAAALTDGFTTNVWTVSTAGGEWRQVTDFGGRATMIARRVSWSPDGRSIVAAVTEVDADVVLADGLVRRP